MKGRVIYLMLICIASSFGLSGQGIQLQYDRDAYHQIDRLLIKSGELHLHPSLKYYDHLELIQLAKSTLDDDYLSQADTYFAQRLLLENGIEIINQSTNTTTHNKNDTANISDHKRLKHWFYSSPGYLLSKYSDSYFVRFNPILNFQIGSSSVKDGLLFQNTRGLELSGGIGKRFFFFTNIIENQSRFSSYIDDYINPRIAIPGNGFYKKYKSSVLDVEDAFDYLNSTGYLSVKVSDEVGFTLGHGRHFVGSGMRSVLLSDFTNNFFYLQADWKFWKIHYRNIWSEVKPRSSRAGLKDEEVHRKYLATHHLSIAIAPNFHFGLFETVVFDRSDQFELGYLNPVILLRTVEQSLSSPDNVLLGIDMRFELKKSFAFYGQINFDEFVFDELIVDNQGWWGNKYAWQLGVKYIDVLGLAHLDLQIEWNGARPYTFTHRDSSASYSHSNLPLAHPLGANFKETIIDLRYQINHKWFFNYTFLSYNKGDDENGLNYGGNILLPHDTRIMDYDNELGQGRERRVNLHRFNVSYQVFPKFWLDAGVMDRATKIEAEVNNELIISAGIRWNIGRNTMLF